MYPVKEQVRVCVNQITTQHWFNGWVGEWVPAMAGQNHQFWLVRTNLELKSDLFIYILHRTQKQVPNSKFYGTKVNQSHMSLKNKWLELGLIGD
jgi:hypothetical protein